MSGVLPNRERGIWAGVLLLCSVGAGCGSTPDSSTIGPGAGSSGTSGTSGGGSGPVFGQTGGANGGGRMVPTAGTSGGGHAGAGTGLDGSAPSGGSGPSAPDATVSQCGQSIVGLGKCGAQTVAAKVRHPNMLIVLDKSGSTDTKPDGFNVSIWEGLKSALSSALDGAKDRIAFGLDLFPAPANPSAGAIPINDCNDRCCEMPTAPDLTVPIESGATGVPKIINALSATGPGGGTPTAAALARAYEYYTTGAGASLDGDKYVMLATDGGPNCNAGVHCDGDPNMCTFNLDKRCPPNGTTVVNCCAGAANLGCLDDKSTIDQITKLAGAGIKTFVVGIPGTEAYSSFLDQFATAGQETNPNGPPLYYRVDAAGGVAGLTKVFTDITTQLVTSCEIQLDAPPRDPNQVNVAIDCQVVGSSGTDGTDGWILDQTTDPQKIVLQGTLCRWVQHQGAQRVDLVFGCPTVH
jgi:hypothetical protein